MNGLPMRPETVKCDNPGCARLFIATPLIPVISPPEMRGRAICPHCGQAASLDAAFVWYGMRPQDD